MRKVLIGLLSLLSAMSLAVATPVFAQGDDPLQLLEETGLGTGSAADAGSQLPVMVGSIIRVVLSLLGIIFVVLMVYAGFLWMTARGEKDQVTKAKDIIRNSIIGLIIIMTAYAITGFVASRIVCATAGTC